MTSCLRLLPVLLLALPAQASPISGVTAIASDNNLSSRPPVHAVDGTGLNLPGNPDNPSLWEHQGGSNNFGQDWNWLADARSDMGNPGVDNQWIAFDLGAVETLGSMNVFNFGVSTGGNNARGTLQADIYYRSDSFGNNSDNNLTPFDPAGWTLLGTAGTQSFAMGPTNGDYQAADNIDLMGISARYFALDINTGHGDANFVGIGEVQFFPPIDDPTLDLDAGSPNPNFTFSDIFDGSGTRTVSFGNTSFSGSETITIDSISLTDDGGGIFGGLTVTYDAGNTGTPPVLEDGDTVSIGVTATSGVSGLFAGTLTIDTTSTGSNGPDFNDTVLPLSAEFFQVPVPVFGAADINGNGLPDFAELLYPEISEFPPGTDSDGDGASNAAEGVAGTDPFNANSVLRSVDFSESAPDTFEFTFATVAGKRYVVDASGDLGSWSQVGSPVVASGAETTVAIALGDLPGGDEAFVRAGVLAPIDTDADGLEDELEIYLGYDPANPHSVRSAANGGDLEQFVSLMRGGSVHGGLFGTTTAGIPSDEQASRFLAQATFGPTDDKITDLRALGPNSYETWIDQQLAEPANYLRTYMDVLFDRRIADDAATDYSVFPHYVNNQTDWATFRDNTNTVWMRQALFADDELRQRVAWALSQIVVTGPEAENSYGLPMADWYDAILRHSLGSYRDLLYDIAVHPYMGLYLSHIGNRKADPTISRMPDENFAREIMQLFSIGLVQLNTDGTPVLDVHGDPIETYTNDDITQLARVFTGMDLENGTSGRHAYANSPMEMYEDRHDTGDATMAGVYDTTTTVVPGEKAFLGATLPPFSADPGRTGLDDVSDAVDVLINHPNCPPFISKLLIQHLVTSNPSPAYVQRVANVFADDGTGVRGNLGATVKAILLDAEARNLSSTLDPASGRLKGPMLRIVSVARALEAGAATPALHDLTGIQFWSPRKQTVFPDLLEYPFESPSVFNFYGPNWSRPGEVRDLGLVSPEFEIMNQLSATTLPNRLWWFFQNGFHTANPAVTPDFSLQFEVLRPISVDTDELVDRLNLIFCHGTLSPEGRSDLKAAIDFYAATDPNWMARTELAVYVALISPDGAVLK